MNDNVGSVIEWLEIPGSEKCIVDNDKSLLVDFMNGFRDGWHIIDAEKRVRYRFKKNKLLIQ